MNPRNVTARQSCEVKPAGTYLGIVSPVLLLVTVPADCVIIEAGIFDEADPLAPPRRNVAAVVLVEVFPEESCKTTVVKHQNYHYCVFFFAIY